MDTRGRSRDVSPIALARRRILPDDDCGDDRNSQLELAGYYHQSNLPLLSPPHDHHHTTTTKSRSTTPTTRRQDHHHPVDTPTMLLAPPVASTSTIPSPPSYPASSSSSRTSASTSTSPSNPPFMRTLSSSTLSVSPDPSASGPLTPPEYIYSEADLHRHGESALSLAYYDSPPSPPRTLQDQMQVAYALDNMHLAKVLLLKLQGIEVTSDDDPRIAQVKDADFNDAFVPPGGLMLDDELEKRYMESERKERERRGMKAREERLKACERIWENSIKCLREEKDKVVRRKEDKLRQKRRSQIEAREREREAKEKEAEREQETFMRYTRQLRVSTCSSQRAVLSYGSLPASSCRVTPTAPSKSPPRARQMDTSFQYPIMQPVHSPPSTSRHLSSSPKSPLRAYNDFAAMQSRNVPFSNVVACMHGPLFPRGVDEVERFTTGRSAAQVKLFDDLLRPARWEEDSRSRARTKDRVGRRKATEDCVACSLDSESSSQSPMSGSSGTESTIRSPASNSSWFSFSVRSSISTLLTTPSLSSLSSAKDADIPVIETEPDSPVIGTRIRHSCPRSARIVVDQHPLGPVQSAPKPAFAATSPTRPSVSSQIGGRPCTQSRAPLLTPSILSIKEGDRLITKMSRSVSTFIDMATSFQRAYVKATMFNVGVDGWHDGDRPRSKSRESRSTVRGVVNNERRFRRRERSRGCRVRIQGYRASPADVSIFISPVIPSSASSSHGSSESSEGHVQLNRPLIPLHPLNPSLPPSASSSHTVVERKLPPPAQPPRSPFRLPYPPPTITSRLRPIANPLLLRMRALQNSCSADHHMGPGGMSVRLISGPAGEKEVKEKMVGVAWEGIGRSGLSWEVSVC